MSDILILFLVFLAVIQDVKAAKVFRKKTHFKISVNHHAK